MPDCGGPGNQTGLRMRRDNRPDRRPAQQTVRSERLKSRDTDFARLLQQAAIHEHAGRLGEAEALLNRILPPAPDLAQALNLLGLVLFRTGRPAEAIERIEGAARLTPEVALFHCNLCEIYRRVGRFDEALAAGQRAVEIDPNNAHAHHNLSVLHNHRCEPDAAVRCAEQALAIAPDMAGAHFEIAAACLSQGDFARGWEEYEWCSKLPGAPALMPSTDRPQWDGRPFDQSETLLLIADQGHGDTIQFSRYIPWAAARCPAIAVACARDQRPVIAGQPGVGLLFDHWDHKPDFVAWCALSSLPRLAGTRVETIPAAIPYLSADPARISSWAGRLAALAPHGYRRIGLVWAGRATHVNDLNRSATPVAFAPLAELPGVALVALQKDSSRAEAGRSGEVAPPLINLGPEIGDWGDTMAILESLDLIVTVDTAVAHLAGAMGKPVWIMLPYAADWRWLRERSDSPWYPTARLFRQSASRDWTPVIAAIRDEIAVEWHLRIV
jgi:tetratricopeptide (TPR) repeat protein